MTTSPFTPPTTYLDVPKELSYPDTARRLVFELIKDEVHVGTPSFTLENVFLVWFSKSLQNWKALVSTTLPNSWYFEVTFNGDDEEAYVDLYGKIDNTVVKM